MTWHAVSFGPQYISPHNSGDVTSDNMGTIPPRSDAAFGWLPDGPIVKEPERQKINSWIRNTPLIDGVIDFDEVLAAPLATSLPNAALYIPDLLHPNPAGFTAMGDSVNIDTLLGLCNLN